MYRTASIGSPSSEQFKFPTEGKLSSENRWVRLSQLVPWEEFEAEYAEQFSETQGAPAKPFRMALGALLIKERQGLTDEETVEQIRENPYLQMFIGLEEYTDQAPFDPSMMVHFRKRITLEMLNRINESMVLKALIKDSEESSSAVEGDETLESVEGEVTNQGKLTIDASCAPADIHYPTDLQLLNDVRELLEGVIDELYGQQPEEIENKPRTYRKEARKEFLKLSRKRRPSAKQRRKGIRKQLNYIRRDLAHIDALLEAGASLALLSPQRYRLLLVCAEVYRQQLQMYEERSQRVEQRIVSLTQPHVRPIVRGKAGHPTEFGAKFSVSFTEGFVFVDHLSWDNFNEGGDLQQQAQAYKTRFGYYPEVIYADAIYRTRENRKWCKQHNIRLMGPPLGRPAQAQKKVAAQQLREDEKVRTLIEGKFGQGKRRFGLARIMAKLAGTAETTIGLCFLVMNLEYLLRQERSLFFIYFGLLKNLFRGKRLLRDACQLQSVC